MDRKQIIKKLNNPETGLSLKDFPMRNQTQAIREFCLECTGRSAKECEECGGNQPLPNGQPCPLWPFRYGINPYSNRTGQNPDVLAKSRASKKCLDNQDVFSQQGASTPKDV